MTKFEAFKKDLINLAQLMVLRNEVLSALGKHEYWNDPDDFRAGVKDYSSIPSIFLKVLVHLPLLALRLSISLILIPFVIFKNILSIIGNKSRPLMNKALLLLLFLPNLVVFLAGIGITLVGDIATFVVSKATQLVWKSLTTVGNYFGNKFSKEPEFKFTSEAVANSLQEEFLVDNSSTLEPPVAPEKQQSKSCADIVDPLCWFHKKATVSASDFGRKDSVVSNDSNNSRDRSDSNHSRLSA